MNTTTVHNVVMENSGVSEVCNPVAKKRKIVADHWCDSVCRDETTSAPKEQTAQFLNLKLCSLAYNAGVKLMEVEEKLDGMRSSKQNVQSVQHDPRHINLPVDMVLNDMEMWQGDNTFDEPHDDARGLMREKSPDMFLKDNKREFVKGDLQCECEKCDSLSFEREHDLLPLITECGLPSHDKRRYLSSHEEEEHLPSCKGELLPCYEEGKILSLYTEGKILPSYKGEKLPSLGAILPSYDGEILLSYENDKIWDLPSQLVSYLSCCEEERDMLSLSHEEDLHSYEREDSISTRESDLVRKDDPWTQLHDLLSPGIFCIDYQLSERLGIGGFGEVWKGKDYRNRECAIKKMEVPS